MKICNIIHDVGVGWIVTVEDDADFTDDRDDEFRFDTEYVATFPWPPTDQQIRAAWQHGDFARI